MDDATKNELRGLAKSKLPQVIDRYVEVELANKALRDAQYAVQNAEKNLLNKTNTFDEHFRVMMDLIEVSDLHVTSRMSIPGLTSVFSIGFPDTERRSAGHVVLRKIIDELKNPKPDECLVSVTDGKSFS